jgi:predicted TIM-barrel fold metal-dependent hydrolase
MTIVDVHHHLLNEDDYLDNLLRAMDACAVEQVWLSALGRFGRTLFLKSDWNGRVAGNEDVATAVRAHPDRVVGFGFVQLGVDEPALVDRLVEAGFRGLKFHFPTVPYHDPRCFEVYEKANQYGLPLLFHTGIFMLPEPMPGEGIGSVHCQPVYVDAVANQYPTLPMIVAHMGIGWYDVAATMARILPNVYVDFSGNLNGWRVSYPPAHWKNLLYWEDSHRKVLFGSDVNCRDLSATIRAQRELFESMGFGEPQLDGIFHGNARRIMDGAGRGGGR